MGTGRAAPTRCWNDRDGLDLLMLHERTAVEQRRPDVLLSALRQRQKQKGSLR
jgi:hypothetical protein